MPDDPFQLQPGEFVVSSTNDHGIGRLCTLNEKEAVVEYFDAPGDEGIYQKTELFTSLIRAQLEAHSRVYIKDEVTGSWTCATLVWHVRPNARVIFPDRREANLLDSRIFVRWNHEMRDPSALLANRITDSGAFAVARRHFLNHMSHQKSAAGGMPCLLSSAVDLEHHQIEIVRRVLRDPVPRYLLGDEVGLGKTIEAGFLVRQHVYDNPRTHRVLVIVPSALKQQWGYELKGRFGLSSELEDTILVRDTSSMEGLPADFSPTMIVVDEAHQVAALFGGNEIEKERFDIIRKLAISVPVLLLLTATPLLHNERDYLTMLHLLDPQVYALEDLAGFRARVIQRQEIAELCFTLNSQTPNGFLSDAVNQLRQHLPHDPIISHWAQILWDRLDHNADESDELRNEAIQRVRTHLSEVYKLHRRLQRNRRVGELRAITPGRSGVNCLAYVDPEVRYLFDALDAWREHVQVQPLSDANAAVNESRLKLFRTLLSNCLEHDGIPQTISAFLASNDQSLSPEEDSLLRNIEKAARAASSSTNRHHALAQHISLNLSNSKRWVVFCSSFASANGVFAFLKNRLESTAIVRHRLDDSGWHRFYTDESVGVLVCDRTAEEGLNLQGREAVIVHFDLPSLPMRVEQRMGRLDRFSRGTAIRSVAIVADGNRWEEAWLEFLRDGLGIFRESIASLQYAAAEWHGKGIANSFVFGPEAFVDLADKMQGDTGEVACERRMIEEQDALDAMELSSSVEDPFFENLLGAEKPENIASFETALRCWAKEALGLKFFEDSLEHPGAFRLTFAEDFTFIPKQRFTSIFKYALDRSFKPRGKAFDYRAASRRMSFGRRVAQERRCLVARYGETFLDSLFEFTRRHERGKVYAFWRCRKDVPLEQEGSYLRFDFILEADDTSALLNCGAMCNRHAIRREADAMLPPLCVGIWLNSDHSLVSEPLLLNLLEAPFSPYKLPGAEGDYDLTEQRWRAVEKLEPLRDWHRRLERSSEIATAEIRKLPSVVDRLKQCQLQSEESIRRFERQMESRLSVLPKGVSHSERIQFNQELGWRRALTSALSEPKFILDSIGAVVLDHRSFKA